MGNFLNKQIKPINFIGIKEINYFSPIFEYN